MTVRVTGVTNADYYLHGCGGKGPEHAPDGPADYYTEIRPGAPGMQAWMGSGAAKMGLEGTIDPDHFKVIVDELVDPLTGEKLGQRPSKFRSEEERLADLLVEYPDASPEELVKLELRAHKAARQANHAYDVTASLPKSWSVRYFALRAEGRHEEADQMWEAINDGLRAVGDELAKHAMTRPGVGGPKVAGRVTTVYEPCPDLIMAPFLHQESRDGEPQLHAHLMVLNRGKSQDGKYRSLFFTDAFKGCGSLDQIFLRTAEASWTRRSGDQFATRPDGKAREILGITDVMRGVFSSRRRAIVAGVEVMKEQYEERYGRPASDFLLYKMHQSVTLATRKAKPKIAPDPEVQLTEWNEKLKAKLQTTFADVAKAVDEIRPRRFAVQLDPQAVISQAIASVSSRKAEWSYYDLHAEIGRALPDGMAPLEPAEMMQLLDELTEAAIRDRQVVCLTPPDMLDLPDELRRDTDGKSVFESAHVERYSTLAQLCTEDSVVAASRVESAPTIPAGALSLEHLQGTYGLDRSQAETVHGLLTDGKLVSVAVAEAGAGKTKMMAAYAAEYKKWFGVDPFGTTESQAAANVMADEGFKRAANTARFLNHHERLDHGKRVSKEAVEQLGMPKKTAIVADEASMMTAATMAQLIHRAQRAKGKVVFVLDPYQLEAVGPAGMGALLAEKARTYKLDQIWRFKAEWEKAASRRLRVGDIDVIHEYDRHGRIMGGTAEEMTEAAYQAFLADHLGGRRSVLVVGTNDDAAYLSSRVQEDLTRLGRVSRESRVDLRDELEAGTGDLIQTRRNNWTMRDAMTGETFAVINRDVWRVVETFADGHAKVQRQGADGSWERERVLNADYLRKHATLAYASTEHSVQGRTVDVSRDLIDRNATRAAVYVGMSRGTDGNYGYVITEGDETARSRMVQVLQQDRGPMSATAALEEEMETAGDLGRLNPQWQTIVTEHATARYDKQFASVLSPGDLERLTRDKAAPALYRLIRSAEVRGINPDVLIHETVTARELASADSVAQVLHTRIKNRIDQQPQRVPNWTRETFVERTPVADEPRMAYALRVAEAADKRSLDLGERAAETQPAYLDRLGPVPIDDPVARMEWVERAAAVEAYREMHAYRHDTSAIGLAPSWNEPEMRCNWEQAANALGLDAMERDMAELDEGQLRNVVAEYEREEAWMPRNVDKEMSTFFRAAEAERVKAVRLSAQGAETERIARAEQKAREMAEKASAYEYMAEQRDRAVEATAEKRERRNTAKAELRHRGLIDDAPRVEDATKVKPAPYVEPDDTQIAVDLERARQAQRVMERAERDAEQARRNDEMDREAEERAAEAEYDLER